MSGLAPVLSSLKRELPAGSIPSQCTDEDDRFSGAGAGAGSGAGAAFLAQALKSPEADSCETEVRGAKRTAPSVRALPISSHLKAFWAQRAETQTSPIRAVHATDAALQQTNATHNRMQKTAVDIRQAAFETHGSYAIFNIFPKEVFYVLAGLQACLVVNPPKDPEVQKAFLAQWVNVLTYMRALDLTCTAGVHTLPDGRLVFSNMHAFYQAKHGKPCDLQDEACCHELHTLAVEHHKKMRSTEGFETDERNTRCLYAETDETRISFDRTLQGAPPEWKEWEGSIKQIALITHNRPFELNRCLESYHKSLTAYGRNTPFYIFDDSNDISKYEENRRIIEEYKGKGLTITYIGPTEKETLRIEMQKQLEAESAEHAAVLEVGESLKDMFGHTDLTTGTYRGGCDTQRNWVLFFFGMSYANRTLCIDDDTMSYCFIEDGDTLQEKSTSMASLSIEKKMAFEGRWAEYVSHFEDTDTDMETFFETFRDYIYLNIFSDNLPKRDLSILHVRHLQENTWQEDHKSTSPNTFLPHDLVGCFELFPQSLKSAHYSGNEDVDPGYLINSTARAISDDIALDKHEIFLLDNFAGSTYATPVDFTKPLTTKGLRQQDFVLATMYNIIYSDESVASSVLVSHHHERGERSFNPSEQIIKEERIDAFRRILDVETAQKHMTCFLTEKSPKVLKQFLEQAPTQFTEESILFFKHIESYETLTTHIAFLEKVQKQGDVSTNDETYKRLISRYPRVAQDEAMAFIEGTLAELNSLLDVLKASHFYAPSDSTEHKAARAALLAETQAQHVQFLKNLKCMQWLGRLDWGSYIGTDTTI